MVIKTDKKRPSTNNNNCIGFKTSIILFTLTTSLMQLTSNYSAFSRNNNNYDNNRNTATADSGNSSLFFDQQDGAYVLPTRLTDNNIIGNNVTMTITSSLSTETRTHSRHQNNNNVINNNNRLRRPPIPDESADEGFTACLILMDDNHYLIEWLAYHYYFLPLRRLFVTIDPKSITSPLEILNRYIGRINITIFNDDYLFRDHAIFLDSNKYDKVNQFRKRQNLTYLKCLQHAKKEGRNWVALIDTDEYIVPNSNALENYQIQDVQPTVYDMLQSPINRQIPSIANNTACISMHRLRIGGAEYYKDSSSHNKKEIFPSKPKPLDDDNDVDNDNNNNNKNTTSLASRGIHPKDFITYRFQYGDKRSENPWAKTMIDVTQINKFDTLISNMNPHRPQKHICALRYQFNNVSTFVVNHYTGSFRQFTFRDLLAKTDLRGRRGIDSFNKMSQQHSHDTNAMFWLSDFVNAVGETTAQRLLQGAGTTDLSSSFIIPQ